MARAIHPTTALHATASRMQPSHARGRKRQVPSVNASVRCRERSKPDLHARAHPDPGVDILPPSAARADRLLDDGIEYLEVEARAEPLGHRGIVVHLHRVPGTQPEIEGVAQEGHEVPADLGARPADSKGVMRASRHHALAPDTGDEAVLDRVRLPVGRAEVEEHPDATGLIAPGMPEVLIKRI